MPIPRKRSDSTPHASPSVSAVLFDLDGTLSDSEGFHRQTLRTWLASRGWPNDPDTIALFAGRRPDDVLRTQPGPWSGLDSEALFAEIVTPARPVSAPPLATGAAALLRNLTVPTGLVTSATPDWARTCLADLLDTFAVVVTRDDITHGKPDPECYLHACAQLQLDPQDCAAVEDAPAGVEAAHAAGIGLVIAVRGTVPDDELARAHAIVTHLDEVPALLQTQKP